MAHTESHAAVLTIAPVLTSVDQHASFATLGISDMINMGGTVTDVCSQTPAHGKSTNSATTTTDGVTTQASAHTWRVGVRGQGRLVSWASRRPVSVTMHGMGGDGQANGGQTNGGQTHGETRVVKVVDFDQQSGMLCVYVPAGVDTVCVTL